MKFKVHRLLLIYLIIGSSTLHAACEEDLYLKKWEDFSRSPEKEKLIRWAGRLIVAEVAGKKFNEKFDARVPEFYGKLGVFATVIKGGTVRGCFGAFSHSSTVFEAVIAEYLNGAITLDPRSKPLDIAELRSSRIIITITTQPYSVGNLDTVDLRKYGVTVECEGGTSVFVPAEIRVTSRLSRYERDKNCQYGAFRAVTMEGPVMSDF